MSCFFVAKRHGPEVWILDAQTCEKVTRDVPDAVSGQKPRPDLPKSRCRGTDNGFLRTRPPSTEANLRGSQL